MEVADKGRARLPKSETSAAELSKPPVTGGIYCIALFEAVTVHLGEGKSVQETYVLAAHLGHHPCHFLPVSTPRCIARGGAV